MSPYELLQIIREAFPTVTELSKLRTCKESFSAKLVSKRGCYLGTELPVFTQLE